MLRLFPLRRSFSLDLAPDDSNSNFLLHVNDDSDLIGQSNVGAHIPHANKSSALANHEIVSTNMTTAVHWPVDDIDDALAADFDGSLSGLGIELGTASFNMSEALMALPSLSSLKHQDSVNTSSDHNSNHPNFILTSSLQAAMRHNEISTSLESTGSPQLGSSNAEEKPVAVVHGKKNRLAYGTEDEVISTSIKRFCVNNERELANVHILLPNNLVSGENANGVGDNALSSDHHEHQCGDECLNPGTHCHLRHSSSVPDLRSNNFANNSFSPSIHVSHSAASSPTSSSTSTPSTTFFSQIISSQLNTNISTNIANHDISHSSTHNTTVESSKFQYVLGASTSMAIRMNEETMTYLNQGQSYEIKLKKVGDLSEMKGKMLKTIIRICFHDRRLQYMEKDLIEQWKEQRPSERILEIDIPLSYGISDVRNDVKYINRAEFNWDPTKETGVFIRINCISTEFTPKKHGGEKGVPFRVVIETYSKDSSDPSNCLHAASCQVKVFKPKGADRKHKTDREKMSKKPVSEQEKFQPSYDCTVFTDSSLDAFMLYSLSSSGIEPEMNTVDSQAEMLNKMSQSSQSKPLNLPTTLIDKSTPMTPMFSELSDNSFDLTFANYSPSNTKNHILSANATYTETHKWLQENRFEAYQATFENFSGADLLLLSKDDLIHICGLTDGIRLYNALHSKNVKSKLSIYICSDTDDLFRAIYLDTLTVNELQTKIVTNLLKSSKCTYLKRLCIMGPAGVKILVTDDVVCNLADESLYVVEFSKDYNGDHHAVMKPFNIR